VKADEPPPAKAISSNTPKVYGLVEGGSFPPKPSRSKHPNGISRCKSPIQQLDKYNNDGRIRSRRVIVFGDVRKW